MNRCIYITLLTVLGFNSDSIAQAMKQPPRLVVNITIDQLRSDYLELYAPLYGNDGFKRLLNEGLVFANASYPFAPVDRASATALLATGTTPYYNSIVASEWLNRNTLQPESCVKATGKALLSPENILTSTVGDELKMATQGQAGVFSIAPYSDASIISAGHAANGAAWPKNGKWENSGYYSPANSLLQSYCRRQTVTHDINKSIIDLALSIIHDGTAGADSITDILNIMFARYPYTIETKPHTGDRMLEAYTSLDRNIAELVRAVEDRMPLERVLFVLTGTGYSEEEEKDNERFRIPTGQFNITRTKNLLNIYLSAIYGNGQYVEANYKTHLYLNRKLIDQKNINYSDVLRRSQEFLLDISGVRNVYTSLQLRLSDSNFIRNIRNGFYSERSGDIIIEVSPGWKTIDEDRNTSYTQRLDNIQFPIVFFGAGINHECITSPVTTDRIAPTIAKTIRIRAPNACTAIPLF